MTEPTQLTGIPLAQANAKKLEHVGEGIAAAGVGLLAASFLDLGVSALPGIAAIGVGSALTGLGYGLGKISEGEGMAGQTGERINASHTDANKVSR